jgi:hypothetical protein
MFASRNSVLPKFFLQNIGQRCIRLQSSCICIVLNSEMSGGTPLHNISGCSRGIASICRLVQFRLAEATSCRLLWGMYYKRPTIEA